jgi:dUTPase
MLSENQYPDLSISQPALFKKLQDFVYPADNSYMSKYFEKTITFLKDKIRSKNSKKLNLNSSSAGEKLIFSKICAVGKDLKHKPFSALIDTGAANSLIHTSIVEKYNIPYEPLSLKLCTASGVDTDSVIGKCHMLFALHDKTGISRVFCTNFVISKKLNKLDAILGAEFLFANDRTIMLNKQNLVIDSHIIPMYSDINECPNKCVNPVENNKFDTSYNMCDHFLDNNIHIPVNCIDISHSTIDDSEPDEFLEHEMADISIFAHSIKDKFENETLPSSEEFFDENFDVKFELLEKKFTIEDGDFSHCPKEHLAPLKKLLHEFHDRFSKFKLDVEVTDKYIANLETEPGKKVIQKCRRLAPHKFQFAIKAIQQLEKAGVIEKSNSEWRSNVVMIPKPTSANQLRTVTKADMQSGKQHKADLYRLCLDFRELNKILIFPQQSQFTTLDSLLYNLKGKVVVSLDISSSFFIIPIAEKDRYKTAFWVNDLSYQFRVLVMGLKSSPWHLKAFIESVFSPSAYSEFKKELSENEQKLLPPSFDKIIQTYFDDTFVYADTYEQLFAVLKLVLLVSRSARIKFSIEKSSFFTQNLKVLGYAFDTKEVTLMMDNLKASAITNMKKPSSLYELHSRLSSFQYQSVFIPFLKHISYPLQFLLRKGEFRWTEVEEMSWQLLKQVATLNLRLTIPDHSDNLVLSTDASKVAASANLFREKDGKLELVAVNSKFFSPTDLNKCSYVLESIALAYGLKIYSAYILSCSATVKIFTDAKSLIYAKRNSTHSILLNSTITYVTNFVSMSNIEIYHIPGQVNRLADIMSRAIADNLHCGLSKDHPISKQWAQQIPPLQKQFSVDRDVLFKFLVEPLKPEPQDIHDRTQKRLQEPKTVQQEYDDSLEITPEQKYYCGIRLLEQFNDKYLKQYSNEDIDLNTCKLYCNLNEAKVLYDSKRREYLFENLQKVLDELYENSSDKTLKKRILSNLKEVAMQFIKSRNKPLSYEKASELDDSVQHLMRFIKATEQLSLERKTRHKIKEKLIPVNTSNLEDGNPTVKFQMSPIVKFKPQISDLSNGWDLPLQEEVTLDPMEYKKVDLGIKVILPKGYCALLMNKSSARVKYGVHVYLGLIDIGFHNYMQTVLQNVTNHPIVLQAGTAVAQLLVIRSEIPKFELGWDDLESRDGSFGSTGQNFEKVLPVNTLSVIEDFETKFSNKINGPLELLSPSLINLDNIPIRLSNNSDTSVKELSDLLDFERKQFVASNFDHSKLPSIEIYNSDSLSEDSDDGFEPLSSSSVIPPLSQREKDLLMLCDLQDSYKIDINDFGDLQREDSKIRKVIESIIENKNPPKYFVMKNNILCRQYSIKNKSTFFLGVYIPESILTSVMIYVHKFFNHASLTQTFVQFRNLYYHPFAKKVAQKVCSSCFVCSKTRNSSKVNSGTGKIRSLNPSQPRESISIDIIYFPKSSRGHTHGLLMVDLYSMYLSFTPLKSKSSAAVAKALREYISYFGVPKYVYSDCDQSFRGEVEVLFHQYNVEHLTSYPYTQKQNTVEGHVRIFKNSYRSALMESNVFKHSDWDFLYPLVISRLNSMISKYGVSREAIQFGYVSEINLPIITDSVLFEPLEDDIDKASKLFKQRVGKFMNSKLKNKKYYKSGKAQKYNLMELVMYKVNEPNNMLSHTYSGPARIMDIQKKGVTLRCLKTGENFSVSIENLRKINFDEFLEILPKNFDSKINDSLKAFRYRSPGTSDSKDETVADLPDFPNQTEIEESMFKDINLKKTRSGQIYNLGVNFVNPKYSGIAKECHISRLNICKRKQNNETVRKIKPCIKKQFTETKVAAGYSLDVFKCRINRHITSKQLSSFEKYKEKIVHSSFKDGVNCTIKMFLEADNEHRKVKFSHLIVYKY